MICRKCSLSKLKYRIFKTQYSYQYGVLTSKAHSSDNGQWMRHVGCTDVHEGTLSKHTNLDPNKLCRLVYVVVYNEKCETKTLLCLHRLAYNLLLFTSHSIFFTLLTLFQVHFLLTQQKYSQIIIQK